MSKAKPFNPLTMTDEELIEHCDKQVQALRMALDMIECEKHDRRHVRWAIVDALKEWKPALAEQPAPVAEPRKQEPVAYAVYHRLGGGKSLHWPEQHSPDGDASEYQLAPLYTSPPASKPLTVEEVKKLIHPIVMADLSDEMTDFEIVRAIEAAHGIKENT